MPRNTPEAGRGTSVPNLARLHVTGDEMVAALDKVGVDGAIYISAVLDVPVRRQLCGLGATWPTPTKFRPWSNRSTRMIRRWPMSSPTWKKTPGTVGIRIIPDEKSQKAGRA